MKVDKAKQSWKEYQKLMKEYEHLGFNLFLSELANKRRTFVRWYLVQKRMDEKLKTFNK